MDRSRASFFARLRRDSRDGRVGRDFGAVIATLFHESPVPAETRLKEGAHAHDSDQTGGSVPLPRVGGALSARSRQYQGPAASMSNAAKLRSVARGKSRLINRQRENLVIAT